MACSTSGSPLAKRPVQRESKMEAIRLGFEEKLLMSLQSLRDDGSGRESSASPAKPMQPTNFSETARVGNTANAAATMTATASKPIPDRASDSSTTAPSAGSIRGGSTNSTVTSNTKWHSAPSTSTARVPTQQPTFCPQRRATTPSCAVPETTTTTTTAMQQLRQSAKSAVRKSCATNIAARQSTADRATTSSRRSSASGKSSAGQAPRANSAGRVMPWEVAPVYKVSSTERSNAHAALRKVVLVPKLSTAPLRRVSSVPRTRVVNATKNDAPRSARRGSDDRAPNGRRSNQTPSLSTASTASRVVNKKVISAATTKDAVRATTSKAPAPVPTHLPPTKADKSDRPAAAVPVTSTDLSSPSQTQDSHNRGAEHECTPAEAVPNLTDHGGAGVSVVAHATSAASEDARSCTTPTSTTAATSTVRSTTLSSPAKLTSIDVVTGVSPDQALSPAQDDAHAAGRRTSMESKAIMRVRLNSPCSKDAQLLKDKKMQEMCLRLKTVEDKLAERSAIDDYSRVFDVMNVKHTAHHRVLNPTMQETREHLRRETQEKIDSLTTERDILQQSLNRAEKTVADLHLDLQMKNSETFDEARLALDEDHVTELVALEEQNLRREKAIENTWRKEVSEEKRLRQEATKDYDETCRELQALRRTSEEDVSRITEMYAGEKYLANRAMERVTQAEIQLTERKAREEKLETELNSLRDTLASESARLKEYEASLMEKNASLDSHEEYVRNTHAELKIARQSLEEETRAAQESLKARQSAIEQSEKRVSEMEDVCNALQANLEEEHQQHEILAAENMQQFESLRSKYEEEAAELRLALQKALGREKDIEEKHQESDAIGNGLL